MKVNLLILTLLMTMVIAESQGCYAQSSKSKLEPYSQWTGKEYLDGYKKGDQIAITARFKSARKFAEGLAAVCCDSLWGYIDEYGQNIIPEQYSSAREFSEGLALVYIDKKAGYINKKGEVVIGLQFQGGMDFSEGLAGVWDADFDFGYINHAGQMVISSKQYSYGRDFNDGVAAVSNDTDDWGYINKKGELIFDFKCEWVREFYQGVGIFMMDDRYGCIDTTGAIILPATQHKIRVSKDGLIEVTQYNDDINSYQYGHLDPIRKIVIPQKFQYWYDYQYQPILEQGKFAIIDKLGNMVAPAIFDDLGQFSMGLAWVMIGRKYGYIDSTGKIVIEPQYSEAGDFEENGAKVVILENLVTPNGVVLDVKRRSVIIDRSGNIIEDLGVVHLWTLEYL